MKPFIGMIFVLSIGNLVIEGMFNRSDLYSSRLLDFFCKEGWLIYYDMLVKDRAKHRAPGVRLKPSTSKAGRTELIGHAASCKQLEQCSRDFGVCIQGERCEWAEVTPEPFRAPSASYGGNSPG